MTSVRTDKWLWAARFFKTRALAARACELGRIQSNGQLAKPAREVRIGDMLRCVMKMPTRKHPAVPEFSIDARLLRASGEACELRKMLS
jgi:ribosomal 50S subunit-recycling heat shock protein